MKNQIYFSIILLLLSTISFCQVNKTGKTKKKEIKPISLIDKGPKPVIPAAHLTQNYIAYLKGKRVALFANNTSRIGKVHLVDTLPKMGVNIVKIFGPEHGFRGNEEAGKKLGNDKDAKTGIPIISLYGKKSKPTAEDLANVDVILFDIQDVGVRFYTYISSLQLLMESAIENRKMMIILDRPNPNGGYIDGPVLDTAFRSFVGMQPIPIVYGMTIGEYSNYLIGEGLLNKETMLLAMSRITNAHLTSDSASDGGLNIKVIKCYNYKHSSRYILPEKPSPNLPDEGSILWYPSICLFEGTVISEGRGTAKPFQVFGHPSFPNTMYQFEPVVNAGAASPKFKNQKCYGWNVSDHFPGKQIELSYLLEAYKLIPEKENFFLKSSMLNPGSKDYFFNKLAGNATLMQQIKDGKTEAEIRSSWQPMLEKFKKIRKNYLLYEE